MYGNHLLPVSGNNYILFGSGFRNSRDGSNQTITYVSKLAAPTIGLRENLHTATVSIYPNPAGDYLLVEGLKNGPASLTIHDLSGRTVLETQVFPNRKLDISQLQTGNYLIYFEGQLMQQKLVVR
ncbi:MAG: T9SS type A sorting domain-containing protein [Owenweeksia sp.]|nr:T9SS type A sorting domain-containing protein [Owenweeksia sp.]